MAGGSVFNYTLWSMRYPELSAYVPQPLAQLYFNEAQLYVDNSSCTIIGNEIGELDMFLNMVTAHIAALNASLNGQPPQALVGRISNATEGSVSVSAELNYPPGSAQWFNQTKYGAAFWQATNQYRSMMYIPNKPRRPYPWG